MLNGVKTWVLSAAPGNNDTEGEALGLTVPFVGVVGVLDGITISVDEMISVEVSIAVDVSTSVVTVDVSAGGSMVEVRVSISVLTTVVVSAGTSIVEVMVSILVDTTVEVSPGRTIVLLITPPPPTQTSPSGQQPPASQ
jgi:hypothetical protein